MSKFLNLIENYDPRNSEYFTHVHDFKTLLKSHGIKSGMRSDGVFYIDDPSNEKTFVIKIEAVESTNSSEEDGEAYDVVDATSSISAPAKAAKDQFLKTAVPKIPVAVAKLKQQSDAISKMKL